MELTAQQDRFAWLVAVGETLSSAYRAAYDVAPKTKKETVWVNASKLAADTKVSQRIDLYRSQVRQTTWRTHEEHVNELNQLKLRALAQGDLVTAMKCEALIGKACGHQADKKPGDDAGRGLYTKDDLLRIAQEAQREVGSPLGKLLTGEVVDAEVIEQKAK